MDNNRQLLQVPSIGNLDGSQADNIINMLEENGVRRTIDCLDWADEYPYHPLTTFSLAHSPSTLYIDFFVRSNYLRAINDRPNSPVYEDSCVGVYLQPRHDDPTYYSLMINCIGTIAGKIHLPDGSSRPLDTSTLESISCFASCGSRPFRELEGLFTWNILAEIPLSGLGLDSMEFPLKMKGNFYKCASGTSQPHFLSWMPVNSPRPDFERPECFGEIILE